MLYPHGWQIGKLVAGDHLSGYLVSGGDGGTFKLEEVPLLGMFRYHLGYGQVARMSGKVSRGRSRLKLERLKEGELSFLRGGEGEPLVLLHGIPGSAYAWEASGRQLAERYQVIIPDLLGFGRSDPPRGDYYISAQAVAIRELLVYLGLKSLYLGGHDFGAPVALTLMRLFPELEVRGLVLSATNVFTDTHVPLPLRTARIPYLSTVFYKAMVGNRLGMRMMPFRNPTDITWDWVM